jgi:hypothetical protein
MPFVLIFLLTTLVAELAAKQLIGALSIPFMRCELFLLPQKRLFFYRFGEYFASSPRSRVRFYYGEVALGQIIWYNPAVF